MQARPKCKGTLSGGRMIIGPREVFMEKLIFERGRLILGRMLGIRKMMGLPYASLNF